MGIKPYKTLITGSDWQVTRYIGLDTKEAAYNGETPELCWVDDQIPLAESTVDSAICTEVFEHCPRPSMVMTEICRVLKPGGTLFFTTPFLWPLHEAPFDEYRFTPYSLRRHLEESGFVDPVLEAMGGWDKSLAQMIGLWARRKPRSRLLRILVPLLAYPVYRALIANERGRPVKMTTQCMITGLSGTAMKPSGDAG